MHVADLGEACAPGNQRSTLIPQLLSVHPSISYPLTLGGDSMYHLVGVEVIGPLPRVDFLSPLYRSGD